MLIERGDHFGGMTASGLGSIDTLRDNAFGGIFYEFLNRVRQYYVETYGNGSEQFRLTYGGYFMEPHVAERILNDMMGSQDHLTTLKRHELRRVLKHGDAVIASEYLDRDSGEMLRVSHNVAIDGTYEGDLAAAAGVNCRIAREGRKDYGERFAGEIYYDWRYHRQEILPESTGEPSEFLQANCFRLTVTDDLAERIPFSRPTSYRDFYSHYQCLIDDLNTGRIRFLRDILWLNTLANRKYCVNGHIEALTSLDLAELSTAWVKADWDGREELYQRYRAYSEGLFYFLQNDPSFPTIMREEARCFGLPKDEYAGEGHFPWQLYVRQGRRIIGEYVITEHDSIPEPGRERPPIHKDSIGIFEHSFDSHACRDRQVAGATVRAQDGFDLIEGAIWFRCNRSKNAKRVVNRPGTIPYRSVLPENVDGLLVPAALSATSVAYSAIRMEPAWMSTGQAAGVAAALSIFQKASVRRIDTRQLQKLLLDQGQVLVYFTDLPLDDSDFATVQLMALEENCPVYESAGLKRQVSKVNGAE